MRRNGFFSKLFMKNPGDLLVTGLIGFAGFAAAKVAGNLIAKGILALAGGTPAPTTTTTLAPITTSDGSTVMAPTTTTTATTTTSGLGALADMASPLGALIAAGIGIPLTMKLVQDPEKREALLVGQVVSALHSVAVAALGAISPGAQSVLSGDDTAVKLAAMYGLNGGTSIMPMYAPVNGLGRGRLGEYIAVQGMGALPRYAAQAGMRGTGEYFATQGVGEYFESGVEGLGNYVGNVDLEQAAAGYGATEAMNTNHVDPSSDLDRELTIAEAAAGVGGPLMQAAAGMGEYFASGVQGLGRGLGAVSTVGASSTWIPGMSDPSLWAGTRAIDQSQEATAQVPAGVLSSGGGQGVFG